MASFPLARYYRYFFLIGALLLIVPTLLRTYLLMPFGGSQDMEGMDTAYFLDRNLIIFRIVGALLVIGPILRALTSGDRKKRMGMALFTIFAIGLSLLADFAMSAERMFKEPTSVIFADAKANKVPLTALVIGVEHGGVAKAYPVTYLGYHHKVQDSVGGMPVLVTYCTMCRTGRVFNPVVDGARQQFRLVGARHYNAVIEDQQTKSWWYQATGEAAAGPKKGSALEDIPYEQVTLRSWLESHPTSLVMQPDPSFTDTYAVLAGYDTARPAPNDTAAAELDMNWVVGISSGREAKGYDWNDLLKHRLINDAVGGTPVLVALENDSVSFHAFKRTVDGATLEFARDPAGRGFTDAATGSLWNWSGVCVEGPHAGRRLEPMQAHQEYWHAWRQFHTGTGRWKNS